MRGIKISDQDKADLASLNQEYADVSQMDPSEREFLAAPIRERRPKKVLEVGVAEGSSAVVLLNALAKTDNPKLYSIDYSTQLFSFCPETYAPQLYDTELKTGHIVDKYPQLQKNWQLFTGGLACNFMEDIGGDIDFCLIDTMHRLPGEILDFLMIFPYLREDALVILHDINLHVFDGRELDVVNNMLISALSGTKLIPIVNPMPFPNIAGVELKGQKNSLWDIFNLLLQHWAYMPNDHDLELLRKTFQKHYNVYFVKMFDEVVTFQQQLFAKK